MTEKNILPVARSGNLQPILGKKSVLAFVDTPMNFWAPLALTFSLFGMFLLPIIGTIGGLLFGHISKWHLERNGSLGIWITYAALGLAYIQLAIILVVAALVGFSALVLFIANL
jgi:hypothetical protein